MQQGPWEGCSLKPAPHHPISTQGDGFEIAYLQEEERIHFHCFRSVLISYNRKLKFGAHDDTEEKAALNHWADNLPSPDQRPGCVREEKHCGSSHCYKARVMHNI